MRTFRTAIASLACLSLLAIHTNAQTYSNCNPLTSSGCPADSALGKSVTVDFTKGASDSFTTQGSPSYGSSGVSFTISKSGDAPQLTSRWYIMFGKVSVVLKAAPGAGIVSSFVLQSDDLDEIDWEWLGADPGEVQTNYFGKGETTSYNRGAFHPDSGSQSGFQTYTIEWTSSQITWSINGNVVRVLTPATAESNQYPQTPMLVKMGAWAGGDPCCNAAGTIGWARGPTDYTNGPFTMQVASVSVQDYSTGTQYKYNSQSGNWQDIVAVGGTVHSGGGSGTVATAPAVTATVSGQPIPFDGTHRSGSPTTTPSVYPWVPMGSSSTMSTVTFTNYPGLPSGWTVSSSGKVVPPNSAPTRKCLYNHFVPFSANSLLDDIPIRLIYLTACSIMTGLLIFWRH
jgi:Glycosyl hydrolases family 16